MYYISLFTYVFLTTYQISHIGKKSLHILEKCFIMYILKCSSLAICFMLSHYYNCEQLNIK